jgi:hypothetical protein
VRKGIAVGENASQGRKKKNDVIPENADFYGVMGFICAVISWFLTKESRWIRLLAALLIGATWPFSFPWRCWSPCFEGKIDGSLFYDCIKTVIINGGFSMNGFYSRLAL